MQGLVFDSMRRDTSSIQQQEFSSGQYGGPESYDSPESYDTLDATLARQGGGRNWAASIEGGGVYPTTVVKTLASTILQYPAVGTEVAGALLSSLGQSVLSSVVNSAMASASADNMAGGGATVTAIPPTPTTTDDDYSDDHQEQSKLRTRRTRRSLRRPVTYNEEATESESGERNEEDFEFISDDESFD